MLNVDSSMILNIYVLFISKIWIIFILYFVFYYCKKASCVININPPTKGLKQDYLYVSYFPPIDRGLDQECRFTVKWLHLAIADL